MSAAALERALAHAGLLAEVEARDRLAIIRAADTNASRAIGARRGEVTALASAHGFSHVALELAPSGERRPALRSDAALPGD